VHQVENPGKQARNSYEQEESVVQIAAGIPEEDEDGAGHDDRGYFHNAVEQQVIALAENVEAGQDHDAKQNAKMCAVCPAPLFSQVTHLPSPRTCFQGLASGHTVTISKRGCVFCRSSSVSCQ
jgi:hypothetical protein